MVAATAEVPKYFPDELDLPLPCDHKTWHTERLCPTLLAQALGSERLAMFIAQLHYWLQKEDVGIKKHGWQWIYNTEWEWREQFPWMSEHTIGRIRRKLERLGYVVSNNFNCNPFNRTKYSTLDYYRIALETGWNPMGVDLNRKYPQPPQFTLGMKQRGRHKSDSVPLVYKPVSPEQPESLEPPKSDDSALLQNASCTSATMHSALLPVSSIYKEVPNITKSNQETDLKIEPEKASQAKDDFKLQKKENVPDAQLTDELKAVNSQISESESPDPSSAPSSPDHDEKIKATQQYVASLNAEVELAERYPNHGAASSRPIRISELDESAHEVLWKHQESLEQLNVDLHADRIQKAIADNPQHLEDAILALVENSANGIKTQTAATGFLYNALRNGWKPRQCSSAHVSVQVYTPPPQMLEAPKPPSLEELVERKRTAWRNVRILRPSIEAWVEQTQGVIMTHDGPALAAPTNTPSFLDPEPLKNEHFTLNQSSFTEASNHTAPVVSAPTKLQCHQPPLSDHSDAESLSSAAVSPPTEPSPTAPPTPLTKQLCNGKYQPVEILTKSGSWIAGFFVHSCMVVANLVGQERRFTLFDASGGTYIFFGQIRPQSNT